VPDGRGWGGLAYRVQDSGCEARDEAGGPCFVDEVTSVRVGAVSCSPWRRPSADPRRRAVSPRSFS